MATQKIFAQHNSRIDLSALGNKNQVQVAISGPDLKLTSPKGSVTIVNGAMYSSLKDSQLSFQFQDGALKGKDLLSQVNLENIDFKSADSFLVDQVQNKVLQEEQEALKQKMRQAEKDKEEAEKARAKAEKEKAEAQKAALEAQEAQKSSQQIEEALNEFLTQANTKAALAQITPDERDISLHSASSLHKESSTTVEVAQVNKNTNRSSGLNNPAPNPKIDLKISFGLDDNSNTSGQKDNLTKVTSPKLVGTTMPGTEVTIQKGSTTLGSTKADGQGNFTFTPTDLTDGPHEFMALGEYKGNKAQAKLSLVIKSSTQTPTFEMNSQDIAVDSKTPDIFLIKNVTPTIHGKAESNTQVSIYNKKITDKDKGTRLDTVQVNSVGEWSYTFKDPQLAQGGNSIRVVAEDAAKNTAETIKKIDLDSIPPYAPSIQLPGSKPEVNTNVPTTRLTQPTFQVTSEDAEKIELFLNGEAIDNNQLTIKKVSEENGVFDVKPTSDWAAQIHHINVIAIDERGNRSEPASFGFKIDNDAGAITAKIHENDNTSICQIKEQITNKTQPKFQGTAKARSTLELSNNNNTDQNRTIKVTVDDEGKWVSKEFPVNTYLEEANTLNITIIDPYGNQGSHTFSYLRDTKPPEAPTDISFLSDSDFWDLGGKKITNKENPTIKGNGEIGSWIWIYTDNKQNLKGSSKTQPYAKTEVDKNGEWQYQFTRLVEKSYNMKFIAQDAANNFSNDNQNNDVGVSEFTFTVQTRATPLIAYLSEDSRSIKGKDFEWKTNKTQDLKIEGTADKCAHVTLLIKKKAGSDSGTSFETEADSNSGKWQISLLNFNLDKGDYSVQITAKSGNLTPINSNYKLTIKPEIDPPTISIDQRNGDVYVDTHSNVISGSQTPTFIIRGENESEFTATFTTGHPKEEKWKFEKTGKIPSNRDNFELKIEETNQLKTGEYQVQVKLEDDLGNESLLKDKYIFTVDPNGIMPTITLSSSTAFEADDHNITRDKNVILVGTASQGSTISLQYAKKSSFADSYTINNEEIIAKNGNWSAEVKGEGKSDPILKDGEYFFRVNAKNANTNESKASSVLKVTVDRHTEIEKIELVHDQHDEGLSPNNTKLRQPRFKITVPKDVKQIKFWAENEEESTRAIKTSPITKKFKEIQEYIENSGNSNIWTVAFNKDLPIQNDYKLMVEVIDHAGNGANNYSSTEDQNRYLFSILAPSENPTISFDEKTKTGESSTITKDPNPIFSLGNIKIDNGNGFPEVVVTITPNSTEEKQTIIAARDQNGGWSAKCIKTLNQGSYEASVQVTYSDKQAPKSPPFQFQIKTQISDPIIDLPVGSSHSFVKKITDKSEKIVAKKENFLVFHITTDQDIDGAKYIDAKIEGKMIKTKIEEITSLIPQKKVWKLEVENNFQVDDNHILSVTVRDKAGNEATSQGEPFRVLPDLQVDKIEITNNTSLDKALNMINAQEKKAAKFKITLANNFKADDVSSATGVITLRDQPSDTIQLQLSLKENLLTFEINDDHIGKEGEYTLHVTVKDIRGEESDKELDFEVDTTLNKPTIELCDDEEKAYQEQGKTKKPQPYFKIGNIPTDIYSVSIKIDGKEVYKLEELQLNDLIKQNKQSYLFRVPSANQFENNKSYAIEVVFTDKANNQSFHQLSIQKEPEYVLVDPQLSLTKETDSGEVGDFKTNHPAPVFIFENKSDTTTETITLILTDNIKKTNFQYVFEEKVTVGQKIEIKLIDHPELKRQNIFPEGKYDISLSVQYAGVDETKSSKLQIPLIINRKAPAPADSIVYSFQDSQGSKTIIIKGKKTAGTMVSAVFQQNTEVSSKNADKDKEDFTIETTWGGERSFEVVLKDDFGNSSSKSIEIPEPPKITRYRALEDGYLHIEGEKVKKGDTIILKNKNIRKSSTAYEFKVQSEDGTFSFNTNTADDNKKTFKESQELTAYVQSKEGYESEKITKSIPKMPDEVAYTFTGNGRYLVVKGKVKNGESLNVKNDNFVQKGNQSLTNKPAWTIVENSNQDLKKFSVFASNHEGGESLAVEQEMPTLLFYWDNDAQRYQGIFNIQSAAADYLPDRTDSDNGLDYVHRLSIKSSDQLKLLVNYKIFESFNANNSVIELDNDLDYELINILSSANSYTWIFSPNSGLHQPIDNKQDIKSNSNMIKFIDKDKVKEFFKLEENFINPSKNAETEARDKKLMKDRWELRPIQLKAKYEGRSQDWGKRKITIEGKILKKNLGGGEFIVTDVFNRKADNLKQKFNPETGKFTIPK